MDEKELLFTRLLRCDRFQLYLERDRKLDRAVTSVVSKTLKRRMLGEPLDYILGKSDFLGLEFKVNRDVLIPRPETEILAETAIRYASSLESSLKAGILELGTGSGCIAVSLARNLPFAHITATDISAAALKTATENARFNCVEQKIDFVNCDLFPAPKEYGMIVSNPPYIATADIEKLQPEIQYEPRLALDGGKDGLKFYRRIIKEAPAYLGKHGLLILEIGFDQYFEVLKILRTGGNFKVKETIRDYNNIKRVIAAVLT